MREEILAKLNSLFQSIIDEEDVLLEEVTTAQDVEDWDSLNHITFIVSIEKSFQIKFTNAEINAWLSVGDIISSIAEKFPE